MTDKQLKAKLSRKSRIKTIKIDRYYLELNMIAIWTLKTVLNYFKVNLDQLCDISLSRFKLLGIATKTIGLNSKVINALLFKGLDCIKLDKAILTALYKNHITAFQKDRKWTVLEFLRQNNVSIDVNMVNKYYSLLIWDGNYKNQKNVIMSYLLQNDLDTNKVSDSTLVHLNEEVRKEFEQKRENQLDKLKEVFNRVHEHTSRVSAYLTSQQ